MMISRFDLSPAAVLDSFAQAHAPPPQDTQIGGQNNVLSQSLSQDADTTSVCWTRYLDTGDTVADYVISNATIPVVWAYGSSNTFGYHGGNRGVVQINLFTGQIPPPDLSSFQLPPSFSISLFAAVPNARNMAFSPSSGGIVYVGNFPGSSIYAFTLQNPSAVVTLAQGLDSPNGVAYSNGALFVTTVTAVTRYDDIDAWFLKGSLPPNGTVLATFPQPPSDQHSWKTVKIGPDGLLYTSVNSPCNTCNDTGDYGTIIRMSASTGANRQTVARGVRDTQGMDWDASGNLFWTDNGRDELGNFFPPDEFNYVPAQDLATNTVHHFGFPYCYGENQPDATANPSLNCSGFVPSIINLPDHIAALGVLYYRGSLFPAPYQKNFFVAAHGSWNRQPPLYSQILFIEVDPTTGETTDAIFLRGAFDDFGPTARFVALLPLPDGSMLVSDDLRGYIYRINYSN